MPYIEVSARTGLNVDECFQIVAEKVMESIENGQIDINDECLGIKGSNKIIQPKGNTSYEVIRTNSYM